VQSCCLLLPRGVSKGVQLAQDAVAHDTGGVPMHENYTAACGSGI